MKTPTNYLQSHSLITRSLVIRSFIALVFASMLTVGCSNTNTVDSDSSSKDNATDSSSTNNDATSDNKSDLPSKKITVEDILTGKNDQNVVDTLQANLDKSGIKAIIISAEPVQVEGLYWVTADGIPSFFTDKAGKHVIQGQVVAIGDSKPVDIGSKLNAKVNKDKLAQVAKADMIIYPAKGETKGVIYEFTDTTCPYCQKQHDEIEAINNKGIEVRYLAWPRNPNAKIVMESVWCSEDRKAAMDDIQAKKIPETTAKADDSCHSIVEAQTELGHTIGVRGTPAIYSEAGEQIGGYLPADQVAKALGL